MRAVAVLSLVAMGFWFLLFSPWTAGTVNFWAGMVVATGVLAGSALRLDRGRLADIYRLPPPHVYESLALSVGLYLAFLFGHVVAKQMFSFAGEQVGAVYMTRADAPEAVIAVLLLFWIGPAEEIFWRGFVQRRLAERYGGKKGWLLGVAVYTAVHIWSFNPMLLLAAMLCGLFWGAMFWRWRSVWPGIISHAVWDVVIFVVYPLS